MSIVCLFLPNLCFISEKYPTAKNTRMKFCFKTAKIKIVVLVSRKNETKTNENCIYKGYFLHRNGE
jgi:hypothetical protein